LPNNTVLLDMYIRIGLNNMINVYLLEKVQTLNFCSNNLVTLCPIVYLLVNQKYIKRIIKIGTNIIKSMPNDLTQKEQRKQIINVILSEISVNVKQFNKMSVVVSFLSSVAMILYH
jgi:hypothetical protein